MEVFEHYSVHELTPFIQGNIEPENAIVTDGWKGFNDLKKEGYDHHQIFQDKVIDI